MPEDFKCPIRQDERCTGTDGCVYGKEGFCDYPYSVEEQSTTDNPSDQISGIDLSSIPSRVV